MKSPVNLIKSILVIVLILYDNPAMAKGKFELSMGYGMPDMLNLRFLYGKNIQVGASVGGIWNKSKSIEILYHFAGKSNYVSQAPWYLLGGLGFNDIKGIPSFAVYDIGFNSRIGRTINFSGKKGINMDIGLFLPLSAASDEGYSYDFKALLSWSIGFFIRL
jgi:hypothetical protein